MADRSLTHVTLPLLSTSVVEAAAAQLYLVLRAKLELLPGATLGANDQPIGAH